MTKVLLACALAACSSSSNNNGDMNGAADLSAQQGNPDGGGGPAGAGVAVFPAASFFYQDISGAATAGDSATIINGVQGAGGWGGGAFQIDSSIEVLSADAAVARRSFTQSGDFYSPDCDPAPIPVPSGGRLEGESGYRCVHDGDCHLLVVQGARLYEMWRADINGGTFNGGCQAIWDLTRDYWTAAAPPSFSRGDGCTSADAAGLPIAPLLFSADEVAAGDIKHAIRFILPNDRIRDARYVHPGTHATASPNGATGGAGSPPYGSRWRLKAGFNVAGLPSAGARVVARALQKYGMILADGGTVALTAQADTYTTAKWQGLLAADALGSIQVTDFDVIDGGTAYLWGPAPSDCQRTPISN